MVKVSINKIGDEWIGVIGERMNNEFYIARDGTKGEIINREIYTNQLYISHFDNQDTIELRKRVLNFMNSLNLANAEKINYSLDYVLDPEAKEDILL